MQYYMRIRITALGRPLIPTNLMPLPSTLARILTQDA
jgi:hypothetical protein